MTRFCQLTSPSKNTKDAKITNGKLQCPAKKKLKTLKNKSNKDARNRKNSMSKKKKRRSDQDFSLRKRSNKLYAGPNNKKLSNSERNKKH